MEEIKGIVALTVSAGGLIFVGFVVKQTIRKFERLTIEAQAKNKENDL